MNRVITLSDAEIDQACALDKFNKNRPPRPAKNGVANDTANDKTAANDTPAAKPTPEPWPLIHARDIGRQLDLPPQLVESIASMGEVVMFYGEPEAGKSTCGLAMGVSLATGDDFLGLRVRLCGVLYLAPEAPGVRQRLFAHMQHYGLTDIPLAVVPVPLDLFRGALDALDHIVEATTRFEATSGHKVGAIFVDTLAMSIGDAEENSNGDMSRVFANIRLVADRTGASVFVIHHSIKSDPRIYRGAGGMGGTLDAVIEVYHDKATDLRVLEVRKQKSLGTTGKRVAARFVREVIGTNDWGDDVTASVIETADTPPREAQPERRERPLSEAAADAFSVFDEVLEAHGEVLAKTSVCPGGRGVRIKVWRERYVIRYASEEYDTPEQAAKAKDAARVAFNRGLKALRVRKLIGQHSEYAWKLRRPKA